MPQQLNTFLRPIRPAVARGEERFLPVDRSSSVAPGMSTLSPDEVALVAERLFYDYVTTNRKNGVPSIGQLLIGLSWFTFHVAFEAEAIARERVGEHQVAATLREAAAFVYDIEDVDSDAVTAAGQLLSTLEVIDAVTQDLISIAVTSRLFVCYLEDEADGPLFNHLPKGGFTAVAPYPGVRL